MFVKQNTSHDTESGQLMLSLNSWKVGRSMRSGTKAGNQSLFDVFCNAFSCHPTTHEGSMLSIAKESFGFALLTSLAILAGCSAVFHVFYQRFPALYDVSLELLE